MRQESWRYGFCELPIEERSLNGPNLTSGCVCVCVHTRGATEFRVFQRVADDRQGARSIEAINWRMFSFRLLHVCGRERKNMDTAGHIYSGAGGASPPSWNKLHIEVRYVIAWSPKNSLEQCSSKLPIHLLYKIYCNWFCTEAQIRTLQSGVPHPAIIFGMSWVQILAGISPALFHIQISEHYFKLGYNCFPINE